MPIEIKELHIRVIVNATPEGKVSVGQPVDNRSVGDKGGDKEAVVAECVEQVLQILQNKQER